jgi:ABC-type dipeptide/oligopeptide/nickel transport system permease subunit
MLNGGRTHLLDAPHLHDLSGLAIAFLVLGFNFLGTACATHSIR